MNIWMYISGNLAADSMMRLFHHLAAVFPGHQYKLITDGFLPTLPENQKKQIGVIDPLANWDFFAGGDLLLLGIMTPGIKERSLIKQAKARKCSSIAFLNDLGGGGRKFFEGDEMILPDCIAVADVITYQNLLKSGIPGSILFQAGSIFLDAVKVSEVGKQASRSVGYLSVPNDDDAAVWGQELGYSELDIAKDLVAFGANRKEYTLTIRKHPKEKGSPKYEFLSAKNIAIEDHGQSSIEEFVMDHEVLVSSYSTGLLVAAKLGRPAISYQPNAHNPVRAELYALLEIPVVTDRQRFQSLMHEGLTTIPTVDKVLFNPGNALQSISTFLQSRLTNTL